MYKTFFNSPLFNAQLVRTLGSTTYQMAEIGECYAVASRITDGDKESWYQEWHTQAENNNHEAQLGDNVSAYYSYLRASSYYRTSYFFLEDNPNDARIAKGVHASVKAFQDALLQTDHAPLIVNIPHESINLPGYLYIPTSSHPCPIIITCAGGDGTKEEAYMIAQEALSRGYACLTFEGPGQGSVLRIQHIPFTHAWEDVASSVIDFLETHKQIDHANIIYVGKSFAGYLAARAITKEKRISACVLDPGQFDMCSNLKNNLQSLPLKKSIPEILESILKSPDKEKAFMFQSRLWRFGATDTTHFWENLQKYTVQGLTDNITCPVLIFDNQEEYLSLGQAQLLYNALTSEKEYYLFTKEQHTGGHCQPLIPRIAYAKIFNWIKKHLR